VFTAHLAKPDPQNERQVAELYAQVGRLMVEGDFWLRRSALERGHGGWR
jgi:hypothetical protein